MLDRRRVELVAHAGEHAFACAAVIDVDAYLDELMRGQRNVDFVHDGRREPLMADRDDRMQRMGTGA